MTRVGGGESPGMVVWMGDEPDVRAWVNADQAAGEFRVRYAELFDAEARLHEQRLYAAANVGAAEHVLDIGCGTGRSTRAAGAPRPREPSSAWTFPRPCLSWPGG